MRSTTGHSAAHLMVIEPDDRGAGAGIVAAGKAGVTSAIQERGRVSSNGGVRSRLRSPARQIGKGVTMTAEEYTTPPRLVGRDATFVRHRLKSPKVAASAYIAPNAVLCGDVTVGAHSRVLFGAIITAEGGPVEIGSNCVIMENAVVRGVPQHAARLGDHVLVGPHASLNGCVIEGNTRIATGVVIFNGARVGVGAEVEFHAVVYVNTVVLAETAVPMGWFAGGDPAELVAPGEWERIRDLIGPLDYPGTVFGAAGADAAVPDIARRYARGLALHSRDTVLPPDQHEQLTEQVPIAQAPSRGRHPTI